MHQLHLLDQEAMVIVTQALVTFRLAYCNVVYTGLPLNSFSWCRIQCSILHLYISCFWVQFMMLVLTFKTLHSLGQVIGLSTSAQPIKSIKEGMLQMPSARGLHLVGPRCLPSLLWHLPSGTISPPDIRLAQSLLMP